MNPIQADDLSFQVGGTLVSLRIAVSAMFATHPNPDELSGVVQHLIRTSGFVDLPEPIKTYAKQTMEEFQGSLSANPLLGKSRQSTEGR